MVAIMDEKIKHKLDTLIVQLQTYDLQVKIINYNIDDVYTVKVFKFFKKSNIFGKQYFIKKEIYNKIFALPEYIERLLYDLQCILNGKVF